MAPPSSPANQRAWALVIVSCDNYNDTWPFLFHFLFKHWPEVPKPVYLIANTSTFADERVQTILVGPDNQWSANVHLGLAQIRARFVFMILDDFFLNANVDGARIDEAWRQFHELNAVYLGVDNFGKAGEHIPGTWFCPVKPEQFYVGLNAVFFQKAYLQKLTTEPGLNIWQTENQFKALARQNHQGHFFLESGTPSLITYVESVRGYFWKPMAIEYLARHGLRPDLNRRPCPPQGQNPFSRLYRSVLKRRMRYVNRLNARLGGRLRPRVIQPLTEAVKPN
jgi:hypothetical protein